jgi:hypothetical protein
VFGDPFRFFGPPTLNLWQLLLVHDSQTGSIKLSIMEATMSSSTVAALTDIGGEAHDLLLGVWTGMLMFHRGRFL